MKCKPTLVSLCLVLSVGCASKRESSIPHLTCELTREADTDCTEVPSLAEGSIELLADETFMLTARYEACYRVEDVEMSGTFQTAEHVSGVDIELLATTSLGGDPEAESLARTVGLISLDGTFQQGRFTDVAMMIRGRGQAAQPAPVITVSCTTY